jgi:F420-dependent oxidoreductase-like protein
VSIPRVLGEIAAASEEVGARHLSVMDHFFQMEQYFGRPDLEMLEGYTTLGYLAAKTSKIGLSLLVTGVTYRHPGVLAKVVTTLDVLSGGRAQLGIGAAWYDREHKGLGIPFPAQLDRYERLDETLAICKQMWSDDNGPFTGKHFQLAETINVPQAISRPHPPILIGGVGEKRTFPLVVKYADACNLFGQIGVDGVRHKVGVLRELCRAAGRAPETLKITTLDGWPESNQALLDRARTYAALGVKEMYLMPVGPDPAAMIRALGPVLGEVGAL